MVRGYNVADVKIRADNIRPYKLPTVGADIIRPFFINSQFLQIRNISTLRNIPIILHKILLLQQNPMQNGITINHKRLNKWKKIYHTVNINQNRRQQ